ncbi:hypothetical protein A1Q_1327 [Vibrio campbellii HY01]|nr:hypothetical protein A1Q_1327 [Vibrio campbellii HY01]
MARIFTQFSLNEKTHISPSFVAQFSRFHRPSQLMRSEQFFASF